MEIPRKFPTNHTYYNYGYYLLTQPLHSLAQPCVVMTTWLTNVCVDPNSESACVAIFGSISVWAAETEIEPSWDFGRLSLKCSQWSIMWPLHIVNISHVIIMSESKRWLAKQHVTIMCRECGSHDCHVLRIANIMHQELQMSCIGVQIIGKQSARLEY